MNGMDGTATSNEASKARFNDHNASSPSLSDYSHLFCLVIIIIITLLYYNTYRERPTSVSRL
jgi:hypothetical protein